ncbi:MAG: glycosyltransferase family 2 protein [Candidatus Acidiferrales bacterium]
MPLVSVLVNTYNHERFIAQAIQSILDQDFPADQMEIIVVDDGSTDSTPQIIQSFLPRIRYIRKQNGGQVSAFNAGVAEAHGDIVAFLDGDDWWAPEKISAVVKAFDENPKIACVGHGFVEVHEAESVTQVVRPAGDQAVNLMSPEAARMAYSARYFLGTSKLSVRRNVVERVGRLPENLIFFDVPVQLLAMTLGTALVLDQALCFYRLHGENLFQSRSHDAGNLRRKYQFLLAQLSFLPPALLHAGVMPDALSALLESDEAECKRLRLSLLGGWPWETFRLERKRFQLAYQRYNAAYAAFKWLVLVSTLLMPPRYFYKARDWYARHNLRRFRKVFGEPVPVASIHARRETLVKGSVVSQIRSVR